MTTLAADTDISELMGRIVGILVLVIIVLVVAKKYFVSKPK